MMIKPSVAELLEKVDNRYELVIATSKKELDKLHKEQNH